MTFSEEHESPAEPFSNVSDIFDTPDMVFQSPETTERVVETQSGFLVVVKQQNNRNLLSVKRRIGTPPTSSIGLTPDESLKLSKILVGTADDLRTTSEDPLARLFKQNHIAVDGPIANKLRNFLKISTVSVLLVGVLLGFLVEHFAFGNHAGEVQRSTEAGYKSQVDAFARSFVSELLDFNPQTYKISQIRAMASMTPDLVQSYWRQTNFPLNRRQLVSVSQSNSVKITDVKQSRVDNKVQNVEVFASLVDGKSLKSNPLHLALKIERNEQNQLIVTELKDLSLSK